MILWKMDLNFTDFISAKRNCLFLSDPLPCLYIMIFLSITAIFTPCYKTACTKKKAPF